MKALRNLSVAGLISASVAVSLFGTNYACVVYKAQKGDITIKFKPKQQTILAFKIDNYKLTDIKSESVYPYIVTINGYDIYQKENTRIAVPEMAVGVFDIIVQDVKDNIFTYAACEKLNKRNKGNK